MARKRRLHAGQLFLQLTGVVLVLRVLLRGLTRNVRVRRLCGLRGGGKQLLVRHCSNSDVLVRELRGNLLSVSGHNHFVELIRLAAQNFEGHQHLAQPLLVPLFLLRRQLGRVEGGVQHGVHLGQRRFLLRLGLGQLVGHGCLVRLLLRAQPLLSVQLLRAQPFLHSAQLVLQAHRLRGGTHRGHFAVVHVLALGARRLHLLQEGVPLRLHPAQPVQLVLHRLQGAVHLLALSPQSMHLLESCFCVPQLCPGCIQHVVQQGHLGGQLRVLRARLPKLLHNLVLIPLHTRETRHVHERVVALVLQHIHLVLERLQLRIQMVTCLAQVVRLFDLSL
mmetsp:Transcript_17408/g.33253  ORF Transcript_17408/g.33253 Transcript_17408/m.33253 type:complete len:334 (-) Transcript_17408:2196-3197(-)